MRQFITFLILVFGGLAFMYYQQDDKARINDDKKIYVHASSSFVAKWGPAPALKELFEKQSILKVEFIESPDLGMTLQKINFENESATVDVVLGMDQFDLARTANKIKWKPIKLNNDVRIVNELKSFSEDRNFIPYDWAPISFVTRKNEVTSVLGLKDLLLPELKGKIAMQDPRTSSVGLQFLVWVFESKSVDEAIKYLKIFNQQVHSFSPSWSTAYGLFKNNQASMVLSYVTSPIYHVVEEKDNGFTSIETSEPLPAQVEFAGIPESCKNCEAAEIFVNFLLSPEAQKIIMNKNYMFPAVEHVKDASAFDAIKRHRILPLRQIDSDKLEKWINTWIEIRKNEGS